MTDSKQFAMPDLCSRRHPVHAVTALMILTKMGVPAEQIEILADGEHEKYKGEIRRQTPEPSDTIGPNDRIALRIGLFSAVDHLPYQFFYGLDSRSATRGTDWDERARRLMAPFDSSVIKRMAKADYEELRFQFSLIDREHLARYLELFGFDCDLTAGDLREQLLWVAMMPFFNQWAGNPEAVERALECLFGYKFSIQENVPARHEIPPDLQYRLGSSSGRLGHEAVLGDSFSESDTGYAVVVHDVVAEDIRRFLPGQPGRHKLEKVLDICMPSHFTRRIIIVPEKRQAELGHEADGPYLGYSSYV